MSFFIESPTTRTSSQEKPAREMASFQRAGSGLRMPSRVESVMEWKKEMMSRSVTMRLRLP